MSKELVIAKYKEDISWIGNKIIQDTYDKIYVYDKSLPEGYFRNNSSIYGSKIILEALPNFDREADTYLYHTITHYNNLSDKITFLQGNPFDHCGNIIDRIKNVDPEFSDLKNLSINGRDPYIHYGKIYTCDEDGAPNHVGLQVSKYYRAIFPSLDIKEFRFSAGAQFTVSKEMITQHDKQFYLHIHNIMWWGRDYADVPVCSRYKLYQNEEKNYTAWAFERLWPYIFTIRDQI